MKVFACSGLASLCLVALVTAVQAFQDSYRPDVMRAVAQSFQQPRTPVTRSAGQEFLALAQSFQLTQLGAEQPGATPVAQPTTPSMTAEQLRQAAQQQLLAVERAIVRAEAAERFARLSNNQTGADGARSLRREMEQTYERMRTLNRDLEQHLRDLKLDDARQDLLQMEEEAKQVNEKWNTIQTLTNLSSPPPTAPTAVGGLRGSVSGGGAGRGAGGGSSGGGGGGGGGIGGASGGLLPLLGMAGAVIGISANRRDTLHLASPFTTDAFGQNEAAGTEGSPSYAPNLPGD